MFMPCGDYRGARWRVQGLAGVARFVPEGSGRGLPIVARVVSVYAGCGTGCVRAGIAPSLPPTPPPTGALV